MVLMGFMTKHVELDVTRSVETIVYYAKKMNIKTIAEFVENEAVFEILKELGVDYTQGYFFSKPQEELL
ncbi:MAG: EAL domain-containing protein [Helicobacteraceae bacterium]|nr:EAL domain-containing protein [Helicobacteraceae bacterium]